ncbi:MAG: hypothetical protein AAB011_05710 [Candidatus Eisenbacteria bacterium]
MPDAPASGPFESAKSFFLLIREGATSLAVLGLFLLLLLSPGALRSMLERAGIQSIKLPLFEMQASVSKTEQELASAKQEVVTAQTAARKAQDDLVAAKAQLDAVLQTTTLAAEPAGQLRGLSARLATSRAEAAASTARLTRVAGTLDQSAQRQRTLSRRLDVIQQVTQQR